MPSETVPTRLAPDLAEDARELPDPARRDGLGAPALFFRRWVANPLRMGSVVPSSAALCRMIAENTRRGPREFVLELGAGTGVISRALLDCGLPAEQLAVVEIEASMAALLRADLPGARVLEGDAWRLAELLPPHWHGRIGTVVCGIPLVLLPLARQRALIAAIEKVAPGRGFLHFSYCLTSPLDRRRLGLTGTRLGWTPRNFPPASLWRYQLAGSP